jgi:hypothetical protein
VIEALEEEILKALPRELRTLERKNLEIVELA